MHWMFCIWNFNWILNRIYGGKGHRNEISGPLEIFVPKAIKNLITFSFESDKNGLYEKYFQLESQIYATTLMFFFLHSSAKLNKSGDMNNEDRDFS